MRPPRLLSRPGTVLLLALMSASVAASAQPPAQAPASGHPPRRDACFSPEFIDGISADNTRTAFLRVGPSDMYQLDMMGPCMNLDWPMTPKRLVNKTGGGDVCDGHDMVLIVGRNQRCYVSAMHKMTPAEIAAWRNRGKHPKP
jgi:Family of unknown function (DUF6491)